MDVDGIVAWWLVAHLEGRMPIVRLASALDELSADLRSRPGGAHRRVTRLRDEVRAAGLAGGPGPGTVESIGVRFLGRHPTSVVQDRGRPAWSFVP